VQKKKTECWQQVVGAAYVCSFVFCVGLLLLLLLLLLFGRVCGVSVVELSEVGSYKRLSESPSTVRFVQ